MTKSDIPPTHTINPIDPPPNSDSPIAAMLKADIDSGVSGDKKRCLIQAWPCWAPVKRLPVLP